MSGAASTVDALLKLNEYKHYNIYLIVHEMMADRGFTPVKSRLSRKQWTSRHVGYIAQLEADSSAENLYAILDEMIILFENDEITTMIYFFPLDTTLRQVDMNHIQNLMAENGADHLIIVSKTKPTPSCTQVLKLMDDTQQLFREEELAFNITKHQLVPKHSKLTGGERQRVIDNFAIVNGVERIDILPGIFTSDPVCKYYNFKVDDLIKIERARMDGYYDISYRIVIQPITDRDKNKNGGCGKK